MDIHDINTEIVETGDIEILVRVPHVRPICAAPLARDLQLALEKWTSVKLLHEFSITRLIEYKEVSAEK